MTLTHAHLLRVKLSAAVLVHHRQCRGFGLAHRPQQPRPLLQTHPPNILHSGVGGDGRRLIRGTFPSAGVALSRRRPVARDLARATFNGPFNIGRFGRRSARDRGADVIRISDVACIAFIQGRTPGNMLVWMHRQLFPRGRSHLVEPWWTQAQIFRGAGPSPGLRLLLIGFPFSVCPPVPSFSPWPPLGGAGGLPLDGAFGVGGSGCLGEADLLLFPFPLDGKGGDPGRLRWNRAKLGEFV